MNLQVASVYVAVLAALLSGCGGGGGGGGGGEGSGGGIVRPDEPGTPPVTTGPELPGVNPSRITVPGGSAVTVAVVDSGARLTHGEFADGLVSSTYNVLDGGSEVADSSDVYHGTAMASIVAGKTQGYSDNAKLMIVKSSANFLIESIDQARGVSYAAQNGARVINTSTSGWQTTASADVDLYQDVAKHDAIWVTSAGNGGLDISAERMPSVFMSDARPDLSGIRDRMLVVGRLNAAGTDRDPDSDYPGNNALLQHRFLLAPGTDIGAAHGTGDNDYRTVDGTSPAAAVVSAAAASIVSKWPHLSATEATSILLDTAKRDHRLYSQNDCGKSKDLNCGAFYMGQGILDSIAALNPVGMLTLALTDTVSGPTAPVAQTSMTVSPAFGDSFAALAAAPVAAFDAYGRDYSVNLNVQSAKTGLDRFGGLGSFMQRGLTQRMTVADPTAAQHVDARMRFKSDGTPSAASLSYQAAGVRVTGYRFAYGESSPHGDIAVLDELPMLSYSGTHAVAADYPAVTGVSGSVPAGIDGLALGFDAWHANSTPTGLGNNERSATRSAVSLQYAPTDWLRLSAGVASLTERDAMLGTRSYGALGLDAGTSFVSRTLAVDVMPFANASIFARYEEGEMNDVAGAGLIDSIQGIHASQFAAGMAYDTGDYRAAFVASAPLRVDAATAALQVPTGRTLDGQVTFDRRTANLSPSGRERTFEFALFARAGGFGSGVQFNLSRTLDPGHNAASKAVNMVALSYTTLF